MLTRTRSADLLCDLGCDPARGCLYICIFDTIEPSGTLSDLGILIWHTRSGQMLLSHYFIDVTLKEVVASLPQYISLPQAYLKDVLEII